MRAINPFDSLYITEKISPEEYVGVVSPLIVPHASKLFTSGNVVIQGTQGSGKTTLLALLKPEIREAYILANKTFPVDTHLSNFISPGINFLKSGILDFGKRPIHESIESESALFPLLFADFFNYYICIDMFDTINKIASGKTRYINVKTDDERLNALADFIKREDCWCEYLNKVNSYSEFIAKLKERKAVYRNFHQFNIHRIPEAIERSKTNIGEPISRIARALKQFDIIPQDTEIFIRVDQIETTLESDQVRPDLGEKYRRIINSALVKRDPTISYKIGSRTYAWKEELRTYNSNETIEENRSYTLLDVDDMIRRRENVSTYFFPKFAKDIFFRRLHYYGFTNNNSTKDLFKKTFGKSPTNEFCAEKYCINTTPAKALKLSKDIPDNIKTLIYTIYKRNPLEGALAAAWCMQGNGKNYSKLLTVDSPSEEPPWNKRWWKKERLQLALMQLASNCNQSLVWGGADDILSLGSAGVLCFLSLCQNIWDAHLRSLDPEDFDTENATASLPKEGIPLHVQTLGISSASKQWFDKIEELPGGSIRQRVVEDLGSWLRNKLLRDIRMSYPGHTGFSLKNSEIQRNPAVKKFLRDATDYGVLFETPHTSKEASKPQRTKWYFNPIYCPYLKIYETRTKEPYYATPSFIENFIDETTTTPPLLNIKTAHTHQLSLFGAPEC